MSKKRLSPTDTQPKEKTRSRAERPSSSGVLIFVAAFLGCLLVFAGIGLIWWKIADPDLSAFLPDLPTNEQTTTTTTVPANPTDGFTLEDRFSVAVFITDEEGALQTATIVSAHPDTGRFEVIGLPAELSLGTSDKDTLVRRFEFNGEASALLSLGTYFGASIDYYISLSYGDAESLFRSFDKNLIVTLPRAVDQQASNGNFSIHLNAGEQALTPKQVANLLRCDNWQGGRRERAAMHATLVEAYLNQFVRVTRDVESDYAKLMKHSDSNFAAERFNLVSKSIEALAMGNTGDTTDVFVAVGTFDGAGEDLHFTPDESTLITIYNMLQ